MNRSRTKRSKSICFGLFASNRNQIGTYYHDLNKGHLLIWLSNFQSGQPKIYERSVIQYLVIRLKLFLLNFGKISFFPVFNKK